MEYFCPECNKLLFDREWCTDCNAKRFREEFKNWSSGNSSVDELIQNTQLTANVTFEKLEWIPYNEFTEVEFLSKGGFGTVYKAFWEKGYIRYFDIEEGIWRRMPNEDVVLKSLNYSKDVTSEFFDEISYQLKTSAANDGFMIPIYGVTQHPDTEDYVMVMAYSNKGSLRNYLNENYYELDLETKISLSFQIASSLNEIHKLGFVHCDFHSGNVVLFELSGTLLTLITDFGLCKSVHQTSKNTIEGVIPYIAPEVLTGQKYSQASDIYSFGIMMNEIVTGLPPYYNVSHDSKLTLQIVYKNLRPKIDTENTPRNFIQLIEKCWDKNPKNRPTAKEMYDILASYVKNKITGKVEIWDQVKEIEKNSQKKTGFLEYDFHKEAFYTSRVVETLDDDLDFDDENTRDDDIIELDF
ncbi:hypothetical protein Glove_680g80 [Diversispora epigaea]|uniref:Protein kinase domain-containing protein n=1 Tax=Diversispora epigaea TaxID=1348612 RepID=A0A397G6A0_9GLOM|nr:hypothetical protein Glove_680g80 [Diversispora epigaea]